MNHSGPATPSQKLLWSRFWRSAADYWRGPTATEAWVLTASLVLIVIAQLFVPVTATLGMVETGTLTATGNVTLVSDDVVDVTVVTAGDLQLVKSVAPVGPQTPGAQLTYTTGYQNLGVDSLATIVIIDAVPAFTQFRVGSAATGTPPASITGITPAYSNDGGATWTYTPVSGGGGAPPSYDANVTHVRFVLAGVLEPGGASAVGVSFAVRIIAE